MKKTILTTFLLAMSSFLFAQNSPVNFEAGGIGADWAWTVFENGTNPAIEVITNPDATGANTSANVAKFSNLAAGQPWAGAWSDNIGVFKFSASNSVIKLKVWKSVMSDVGIKWEKAGGGDPVIPEIKVANTTVNAWEELTFDFSAHIGDNEYGRLVIFLDFKEGRTDNVAYFDDLTFGAKPAPPQNLFFSEYIEGSSNNKALEIFNPTDAEVSLADYQIAQSSNGGGWAFYHTFKSGAIIPAKSTYVLITDQVAATLFDAANADEVLAFPSPIHFNGDDARAIIHIAGTDTTVLDVFGDPNNDPGTAWTVGGVENATANKTLIRKSNIMKGNTTILGSFGTDEASSEWMIKDQDDFSNLDLHTMETPSVSVTFRVNSSTFPDTLLPHHVVQIRGGLQDGSTSALEPALPGDWGATSPQLTNVGGDYWEITISGFAPGDFLKYKFWGGVDAETGLINGSETGWEAGTDRELRIPADISTSEYVIPMAWMGNTGNTSPFAAGNNYADSVGVKFRIEVGGSIETGDFDPALPIQVRGSLSPLTWDAASVNLVDEGVNGTNKNRFYSAIVYFQKAGLATSEVEGSVQPNVVRYEFFHEGHWDGAVNQKLPITKDTTLAFQFYKDQRSSANPVVESNVRFGVNVAVLQGLGFVNENGKTTNFFNSSIQDSVFIRGDVTGAGWGSQTGVNDLAFDPEVVAYQKSFPFSKRVDDRVNYKYYIKYGPSRADETSDDYIKAIEENVDFGYEEPTTTGGGNRSYVFTDQTTQDAGIKFFNDISNGAIINEENTPNGSLELTFSIDMAPAKGYETRPFNPAQDSVYLVLEANYTALTWGIRSGGGYLDAALTPEDIEVLRFEQVGETDIYELALDLPFPTLNDFGFVVRYGQPFAAPEDMKTNGGGFDAGRRYVEFIEPVSVTRLPEDPFLGEVYDVEWPATYKIEVVWKNDDLPFSSTPDYAALSRVSNEDDKVVTPDAFGLKQNFPNPFNPSTNIQFNIPQSSQVSLEVFNLLGQRVAVLLQNQLLPAGTHGVTFDASNLASGMYIYRLKAGNMITQKSMTLIK